MIVIICVAVRREVKGEENAKSPGGKRGFEQLLKA